MSAGPEIVIGFKKVSVLASISPVVSIVQRCSHRICIVVMNLGILDLQAGQAYARGQPERGIEGEGNCRVKAGALSINPCRAGGRLPFVMVARIPQRKTQPVRANLGRLETNIEPGKSLDQLILIIGSSKQQAGVASEIDRNHKIDAEVLFGVVNETLFRNVDKRDPTHASDLVNEDDMLPVASLHHLLHRVMSWPQFVVDPTLYFARLRLIQLLPDELLQLIANTLAKPRFVVVSNLDSLDGITRIDIGLCPGLLIGLLEDEHHLDAVRLRPAQKARRGDVVGFGDLDLYNKIVGSLLVERLADQLLNGVAKIFVDLVIIDAGDLRAFNDAARVYTLRAILGSSQGEGR